VVSGWLHMYSVAAKKLQHSPALESTFFCILMLSRSPRDSNERGPVWPNQWLGEDSCKYFHMPNVMGGGGGGPNHVWSIPDPLPLLGCFPANLVTHSSGRIHVFPVKLLSKTNGQLTCYQANHIIHSLITSFQNWFLLFDVDFHGTMYTNFMCLYHPG
jgi:hypothetical protein